MCRATADGGRRCPCTYDPERRAAYRKGHRNVGGEPSISATIGNVAPPEPEIPAGPDWDDLRAIADDIALFTGLQPNQYTDQELVDRWVEAQRRLVQRFGGTFSGAERAVRYVGDQLAGEAERRAGIDSQALAEEINRRAIEARTELERLDNRYRSMERDAKNRFNLYEMDAAISNDRVRVTNHLSQHGRDAVFAEMDVAHRKMIDERNRAADRYNEWAANDPEFNDIIDRLNAGRRAVAGALPEEARAALRKLSNGYLEAVGQMRDTGGELEMSAKTAKAARTAFDETTEVFPSDWIAMSNDNDRQMLPKVTKSRAHYRHTHRQETRKRSGESFLIGAHPDDLEGLDSQHTILEHLTDDEVMALTDAERTKYLRDPGDRVYRLVTAETQYRGPNDGPPPGGNWHVYKETNYGAIIWRRPQMTLRTVATETVAEIKTNVAPIKVEGRSETFAIGVHEMSHRMEAVVPGITDLESHFLSRRCRTEAGEVQEAVPLYGGRKYKGSKEMARSDKFPDAYMGKVYDNEFTEVMSCGMEGLFGGSFGGLIGVGRYSPDHDMRSFVLGVLACAGRPWDD